nr:F-box protein At5g49610-like [Ipomoea trifida]
MEHAGVSRSAHLLYFRLKPREQLSGFFFQGRYEWSDGDVKSVVTVCQTYIEEDEDEDEDGVQFSFNIYSSQTEVWTKSTEICVCGHNLQKKGCAFVEGVIFWLTNGDHILMFDPEKELSCLVMQPFPASQLNFRPGMCVGEAEGRLQYVLFSKDGLQLWELEDMFSSHWSVKHFISLEELEGENPKWKAQLSEKLESHLTTDTFPWINPLSFKDTTLLLRISTDIYAFNFDTKKAKLLCPYSALGPNYMFSPIVIPYTMSLVPIG